MKYGTYFQRFLAFLIDSVIISIIVSIVWFIFGLEIPNENYRFGNFVLFNASIIGWIIGVFYHGIMESQGKQASYGKRALGIKVCNDEGRKISVLNAMIRNAGKLFSAIPFFAGYIYIFISKKNQALHDILSNAVIVQSENNR